MDHMLPSFSRLICIFSCVGTNYQQLRLQLTIKRLLTVIKGDSMSSWLINSFSITRSTHINSSTDQLGVQFTNKRCKRHLHLRFFPRQTNYSVSYSQIIELCFKLINVENGFFVETNLCSVLNPDLRKKQWKKPSTVSTAGQGVGVVASP